MSQLILVTGKQRDWPIRIVLTSAPGGGKTTAQSCLVEEFTGLGFRVVFLQEIARKLIKEGFVPGKTVSIEKFQEMIIRQQLFCEDEAVEALRLDNSGPSSEDTEAEASRKDYRPAIVFCDRGLLDTAAYTSAEVVNRLSKKYGFDLSGLDRYDGAIILGPCPREHYVLDTERTETYEEALEIAEKIKQAYSKCAWKYVPSTEDFAQKKRDLLKVARAMVGVPVRKEIERKFLCHPISLEELPSANKLVSFKITQTYLHIQDGEDSEERVRMREFPDGAITYHHTIKRPAPDGVGRLEDERSITLGEYRTLLLRRMRSVGEIVKTRTVYHEGGKEIYELDVFHGKHAPLCLLEIETSSAEDEVKVPDWLPIKREVTDDPSFSNFRLALSWYPSILSR